MQAIVLSDLRKEILQFLRRNKNKKYSAQQIARYMKKEYPSIAHIMKMLAMDGLVEKTQGSKIGKSNRPYPVLIYQHNKETENLVIAKQGSTFIPCGTIFRLEKI